MTEGLLSELPPWVRRRAEAYARHPIVRRPALRTRFATFAGVRRDHEVLDVGAGAGFNAIAFARKAAHVTALDWRRDLLILARREAARRRAPRLTIVNGDPSGVPFPDDSFDLVTSAAAVHHFRSPMDVFREMARVCRPGGTVAIEDVVASEQDVRARYHNRLERLRDRSHQRSLSLSEIVSLLGLAGLRVRHVVVTESLRELSEWLAVTSPPVRRCERIRHLLQGSVEQDLSGLAVQAVDDTFLFVQQAAWVVAEKP